MLRLVESVLRDEDGATLVEYAIMLGLIAVICVGAVTAVGTKTGDLFALYVEKTR